MASILVVRDPDPERRRRTAAAARAILHEEPGFEGGSIERGPVTAVWAAGPNTPIDLHQDARRDTLLLGEFLGPSGPDRVTAADYAATRDSRSGIPEPCDGYHVAVCLTEAGALTVAADLLGIFPVYHTMVGEALLVASSPGLLRAHPAFRNGIDPLGIAGLLLCNSLLGGFTIQRGVRRLAAGHALVAAAGRPPSEHRHYAIPTDRASHDVPIAECAERLHAALRDACRRHVAPGVPHTLLLSGGLDSRLLAGILRDQAQSITALTRGLRTDIEYRCARKVAVRLGLPHRLMPDEPGTYDTFSRGIQRDGLVASPGGGGSNLVAALRALGPRMLSGHGMDGVLGPIYLQWVYSDKDRSVGFDNYFRHLNAYGIRVEVLRRLLRRDVFGDSLDEALDLLRETFQNLGGAEMERAWRFNLHHRQRFFTGAATNRHARGAWPVLPFMDRQVLAATGGMPLVVLADRSLEQLLLRRFHPELARLPLDRNTLDTTPLAPDLRGLLEDLGSRVLRRVRRLLRLGPRQRLYYYRTFNFNGPQWRGIREGAEPKREAAYALFDRAGFDALLPPPDRPWSGGDGIVDVAGAKTLLGLVAWLDQG